MSARTFINSHRRHTVCWSCDPRKPLKRQTGLIRACAGLPNGSGQEQAKTHRFVKLQKSSSLHIQTQHSKKHSCAYRHDTCNNRSWSILHVTRALNPHHRHTHLCWGDLVIVRRRFLLLFYTAEVEHGVVTAVEVLWGQPVGPLNQRPHIWDTLQLPVATYATA